MAVDAHELSASPEPCQFCGETGQPLYELELGNERGLLLRCPGCLSCQIAVPFSEEALASYYRDMYFDNGDWQFKSARLAQDYFKKMQQLAEWEPFAPPFLEIGCGQGHFAARLARHCASVVDVIEPNITARTSIAASFPMVKVVAATLGDLPAGQYRSVFCFHVVEHLQRLHDFLVHLARHVVARGKVFLLTPNAAAARFRRQERRWGWSSVGQHFQFLSPGIPEQYFQQRGFRVCLATDLQPAAIHFPGGVFSTLRSLTLRLEARAQRARMAWPWRAACASTRWMGQLFAQNYRSFSLLPLEHLCDNFFGSRPRDELLLVLEKI